MTPLRAFVRPTVLAAGLCLLGLAAQAQTAKAPKTQLWIDLSTGSMAGMPEMDMPMGGGLMGMMGGGRAAGAGGNTHYGMARTMGIMPPRVIDIALHNSLRPGVEARQAIPPGMRMGESLPLLPPKAQPTAPSEPGELPQEYEQQKPKGRILVYWGCGSEVRAGQPEFDEDRVGVGVGSNRNHFIRLIGKGLARCGEIGSHRRLAVKDRAGTHQFIPRVIEGREDAIPVVRDLERHVPAHHFDPCFVQVGHRVSPGFPRGRI